MLTLFTPHTALRVEGVTLAAVFHRTRIPEPDSAAFLAERLRVACVACAGRRARV